MLIRRASRRVIAKKFNRKELTVKLRQNIIKGGRAMISSTSNSFVFEFEVPKGKLNETIEKLSKPSLTKEYLEKCRETSRKYRRNK